MKSKTGKNRFFLFMAVLIYTGLFCTGCEFSNSKDKNDTPEDMQYTFGLVGSYDTAGTSVHVGVSGSYAYVSDYTNDLQILQISNPALPAFVNSIDINGEALNSSVYNNHVFISSGTDKRLYVAGIANPAAPVYKTALFHNSGLEQCVYGGTATDGYAYTGTGDGLNNNSTLTIWNISNINNITGEGEFITDERINGVCIGELCLPG